MNREALDRWCERGILALVLAILIVGPLATGAVRPVEFLVVQGLTVGVMALWGARLWLAERPQFLWPPVCWAALAFVLLAIGRYLTADVEYVARQELVHILVYAFLFFAILNNLYRQETMQIISCTLVFLAMAIAGYAIFQFLTHSNRVWHYHVPAAFGASGTFISRNHLGGFLEMVLPLGLACTLTSRFKPVLKIFLGYASFVVLAGIAVTVSRGAYLSTTVSMAVLFLALLFHRRYRLPAALLLVVLLGAAAYFLPKSFAVQSRLKPYLSGNAGRLETDTRILLWQAALQVWKQNVWWGVGPAHYDYRFRQFRPAEIQLRPGWAHNDYLNALAEWGVAGTAVIASAWVLLAIGTRKTWRSLRSNVNDLGSNRGSNKFALVLGTSVALVAILVHSAVDFNMHIPSNAILAITLMALLSSCLRFATERYWIGARLPGKAAASAALIAGVVFLAQQGARRGQEWVWLNRAAQASPFSPAQAALLEKAFAADPKNADTACAIGEAYRMQSSEGGDNYEELAAKAMQWFDRSMKLNPWGGYSQLSPWIGYGWCLDWLGKTEESRAYFQKADELDPNNYFVADYVGLHYVQSGDYAAARTWFERSMRLQGNDNLIARNYLEIVNKRMMEAATNDPGDSLNSPSPKPGPVSP